MKLISFLDVFNPTGPHGLPDLMADLVVFMVNLPNCHGVHDFLTWLVASWEAEKTPLELHRT